MDRSVPLDDRKERGERCEKDHQDRERGAGAVGCAVFGLTLPDATKQFRDRQVFGLVDHLVLVEFLLLDFFEVDLDKNQF